VLASTPTLPVYVTAGGLFQVLAKLRCAVLTALPYRACDVWTSLGLAPFIGPRVARNKVKAQAPDLEETG
jgi:hypothetical protein